MAAEPTPTPEVSAALREAGIPTTVQLRDREPVDVARMTESAQRAWLRSEAGIPVREAAAAGSAGALLRGDDTAPLHAQIRQLRDRLPVDHPDKLAADRLARHGAALSAGDRAETQALLSKHSALLEPDGATEDGLMDLAESGDGTRAFVDALAGSSETQAAMTADAALADCGIPTKPGGMR